MPAVQNTTCKMHNKLAIDGRKGEVISIMAATVSVLIISYGNYYGLEHTVESVLKQNYPISEIILSDDGSGKKLPERILQILEKAPCKVFIREGKENLGTTAHLNLAAQMSHGTYLKFIAAGDAFWDENSLGALVMFAESKRAIVVTSNALICSRDLKTIYYRFPGHIRGAKLQCIGTQLFAVLAKENIVSAVGTLMHKDFFEKYGGFDTSYRLLEDWPSWLQLAKKGHSLPFLARVTCMHAVGGISSENGDAYHSKALRTDMIRCYEQEILPEMSLFSRREQRRIQYNYEKLIRNQKLLRKKYLDLYVLDNIKRLAKCAIQKKG